MKYASYYRNPILKYGSTYTRPLLKPKQIGTDISGLEDMVYLLSYELLKREHQAEFNSALDSTYKATRGFLFGYTRINVFLSFDRNKISSEANELVQAYISRTAPFDRRHE